MGHYDACLSILSWLVAHPEQHGCFGPCCLKSVCGTTHIFLFHFHLYSNKALMIVLSLPASSVFHSRCNMLRIYTKPKGQMPDYDEPVILHSEGNCTIEQFCNRVHRQLISQFSHALVWGRSAKHQPQRCGKDHILMDEDVVSIVKKVG